MRSIVLFALVLYSLSAGAQLYSWKDADGKTQYSDQPPPGKIQPRKVAPPAAASIDSEATRRKQAEKELDSRKKQKDAGDSAAKAEKEKSDSEERRINCDKAKGNLQAVESGQVRFTTNDKGERVALEGAVRDSELALARKAVDSWCK